MGVIPDSRCRIPAGRRRVRRHPFQYQNTETGAKLLHRGRTLVQVASAILVGSYPVWSLRGFRGPTGHDMGHSSRQDQPQLGCWCRMTVLSSVRQLTGTEQCSWFWLPGWRTEARSRSSALRNAGGHQDVLDRHFHKEQEKVKPQNPRSQIHQTNLNIGRWRLPVSVITVRSAGFGVLNHPSRRGTRRCNAQVELQGAAGYWLRGYISTAITGDLGSSAKRHHNGSAKILQRTGYSESELGRSPDGRTGNRSSSEFGNIEQTETECIASRQDVVSIQIVNQRIIWGCGRRSH